MQQEGIVYRREGSCPLQYAVIRKVLEYIHADLRFTITRYGLDDRTRSVMAVTDVMAVMGMRERLSIHAILNARLMEYFRDVLLGQTFRERMWSIVKSNTAYKDIEAWLRANRCPRVYDAETVKTANEYGIYHRAYGEVYEGSWKDGNYRGQGKCTFANGNVYEGSWKDDYRHGQGKLTFANGDVYEGSWKDDKKHGQGKYTYANGDVYEGSFKDDKRSNQGKQTWSDGRVYEGDWNDTLRHGLGKQTWPDGRVYIGDWEDDKIHGYGKYMYPDGKLLEGDFINNNFQILYQVEL